MLVSYPKSGSTWVRSFLSSVKCKGGAININEMGIRNIADRTLIEQIAGMPTSDFMRSEISEVRRRCFGFVSRRVPGDTIFKVHDAWASLEGPIPFTAEGVGRVLYLIRDPRDVVISLANHLAISLDDAIAIMSDATFELTPNENSLTPHLPQYLSTWSSHGESWLDHSGLNVHVTKYEDLLLDPATHFSNLLAYCGIEVPAAVIKAAISYSSFDSLRQQEIKCGFVEKPRNSPVFFRRGTCGNWKDILSTQQVDAIVTNHGSLMKRFGYI